MSSATINYRGIEETPEGSEAEFWHRGIKCRYTRFASSGKPNLFGRPALALSGEYGRRWLADACTSALEESLTAARANETEANRQERIARYQARSALAKEAMSAKAKPARKRDW